MGVDEHPPAGTATTWPEPVEPGRPVHRLGRRRFERRGRARGARGRAAAARAGLRLRHCVYVRAATRDPHAVDRAGRTGPDVDPGRAHLAAERTPLRRVAGPEQARNGVAFRPGAGAPVAPLVFGTASVADGGRRALERARSALSHAAARTGSADRIATGHGRPGRAVLERLDCPCSVAWAQRADRGARKLA